MKGGKRATEVLQYGNG